MNPTRAVVDPEAPMRPGAALIDEELGDDVIYRGGFAHEHSLQ